MKKINFKQPKYIFPLVTFPIVTFLAYQLTSLFSGSTQPKTGVVTDSINMSLPDAENDDMKDKMAEMNNRFSDDDAYTAVDGLGEDKETKDSTRSGYTEAELDNIDAENAKRKRQAKEAEDMERSLEQARKHINHWDNGGGSSYSRSAELDGYAKELARIQQGNQKRKKSYDMALGSDDFSDTDFSSNGKQTSKGRNSSSPNNKNKTKNEKAEIVKKVPDTNAERFNTISDESKVDEPLIKAMIDQTTKVHDGTRLRFKLLDDVVIKSIKIKKGTYLYGTITGFGQQRVMATITSILVKDKFLKINLSVYDNDGMEGFYVPESTFRSMMKEAGSQAVGTNMNFNNSGMSSELTGESLALQTLQNMYNSASSAVSANMRRNKARIKYNTIVYLINTNAE